MGPHTLSACQAPLRQRVTAAMGAVLCTVHLIDKADIFTPLPDISFHTPAPSHWYHTASNPENTNKRLTCSFSPAEPPPPPLHPSFAE
ncbi:hypothetical protein M406DRAFT_354408 [Cryphonectria parasitica EP155]|uniref:Uncharacterized protein n=1 Tax=Cryphonectria parasitica (strain ATCC 38755 / EP155) TaxID=660469 RepID=A0A9P5CT73_CRYP1|nr:uncharacterized protein M406DRAFT_354408 [Cryphonectria parasitica EP155]KAF3770359.1 hypothetical protein M406DRAFT_354408 [Cryphonectria parasitica EP155]